MSLQKITFTNSTVSAQKDADFYYFLLNDIGVLRGIKHGLQVTNNVNRIVFKSGYVNIYGRMLFVEEDTTVTIPLNQVAYGYVIIRVNTSNNTAELTYKEGTANYPDLTQENIMQEFGIYEFALAKYSKTSTNLALQEFTPKYIYRKESSYLGTENKDKVLIVGNDGYIALQSKDDILVGKAKTDEKGTNISNKFSNIDNSINSLNTDLTSHKNNTSNPHNVTKSQVGLGNVDNTSDLAKPISTATQNALNTKVTAESNKGLVTQQILANTDLNTVKTNGFYGVSQSCTNKPVNKDDGNLIVLQYDSSNIWTTQVYITLNLSENKNRIYSRGYNNSTNSWSSWKQIDNDPSLYNLGAYDTYVDNGDGTTTITRQTGYLTIDDLMDVTWNVQFDKYLAIFKTLNCKDAYGITSNLLKTASDLNWDGKSGGIYYDYDTNRIILKAINIETLTITQWKEKLQKLGFQIQYKLATPYTEKIITGLPQITLDKQGCEWLRSEWEKGLNLFETQMQIKMSAGKLMWRNRVITGLVVGKTYTLYGFSNDICGYQVLPEYGVFKNKTYTFVANATTKEIRVGHDNLTSDVDFTTQIMLIEGAVTPTKFSPYNSSYHITNEQADLLSDEEEKSRNLLDENIFKFTNNYGLNLGYCELKANTTYCLSLASAVPGSQIKIIPSTSTQSILIANGDYSFQKQGTFTPTQDYNGVLALAGTYTDATIPSWAMLNRGSAALPYAAYNGSIVHEKQLSLQAPSMGHKVANECMMNVTGEYYNNSSSDVYILLGNIKPAYKEARDGGFIISGTIGQYYCTQQAQINAVAYWRDKVKWKGLYTQDNSDGNFNNIVDLIITTTNKIYLVIKAGQFGQYNLQLQGKTIQYTGTVLDTIDGSIASTFSQSDAIDLTALDTSLSDKLKFIDNNAITDPDGNGIYKIDNNYIYDEELATNGVDYTPFDGSSSYDSQSEINQDFYKQIKTNKENINSLRGRSLYSNTITMYFTSPDKAVVTLTILDTLPHDDPSSGTSWSFVRDYLNNKGYVLGSYTNWQKTNKVYPCSGSINISSSVQFPIVGISKDSSTNGLFWLHYLAYDGSPVAIAFSTVINSRAHSIQIF